MNQAARRRSGLHRAFVATVFVLGLAALADALYTLHLRPVPYVWVVLALLTVSSDFVRSIRIPGLAAHVSPSEIFLFLIVLLFGGAPAVVTLALGGLTFRLKRERTTREQPQRHRYYYAAFDLAEPALSIWAASHVYLWLGGVDLLWTHDASIASVGGPALAMSAMYFAMNSGLNAVAEAGATGKPTFRLWWTYVQGVGINYVSNASVAVVLAVNLPSGDLVGRLTILALVFPLVVAPYYNLALSAARIKDQDKHVRQTEELNEKLAEILGTTAEAKDRATSKDHIRRVRKFAVRLAERMGISDPQEQKAIRFAGLLHDYGKTVIREEFLNKPGKLSPGEYEIVKTHAAIGSDMVATFGFDFPVVPIIRHHHENWNGTGYPDGLEGRAIPAGARILSVADCYDALRDHRPYRRALSHDEAMAIVRERAGTMYDPDVVRAFESIQDFVRAEPYEDAAVAPPVIAAAQEENQAAGNDDEPPPIELRLSDTATLLRLSQDLSRLPATAGVDDVCEMVSRHLLSMTPAGLVVFFRRDVAADEMVSVHASGFGETLVRDLRMPMGLKVSGWVAANGKSVINQDSSLDLDQRLDGLTPRFKSLLSIPLAHTGSAVGVVTLYALRAQAFREDQRQALELVSGAIAEAFERGLERDRLRLDLFPEQELAGAASSRSLNELLARDRRRAADTGRSRAVLCLKNDGGPAMMLHAMMAVSHSTRVADLIFRPTEDSLVVLMKDADAAAEELVVQRMAAALPADIVAPPSEASPLRLGFACSPRDGEYWSDLLNAAQHRAWRTPADPAGRRPAPVSADAQRGLPWRA